MIPWPLYLAFKQIFPTGRKFTLQTLFYAFSILGVALGVFLLVASQSIMGGFGKMWEEKIVKTGGDLTVFASRDRAKNDRLIQDPAALVAVLKKNPEIKGLTPFAGSQALIQFRDDFSVPDILALDPDSASDVLPLKEFIVQGSLADGLHDQACVITTGLAQKLGVQVGDLLRVTSPTAFDKFKKDEITLARELEVIAIANTGFPDLDRNTMFMGLPLLQDLDGLGEGVHGVLIRLENRDSYLSVQEKLKPILGTRLAVASWKDKEGDLLFILGMERTMILLLTIPIYIVSGFVIICTQLVVVFSKTREIGLLGALGARPSQLALGYCLQGGAIGFLGAVLGLVGSLGFLEGKDVIVRFISRLSGDEQILSQFYAFYDLPVHYEASNIVLMLVSAVVLSTLASVIPAIAAARKKPAEALRSE